MSAVQEQFEIKFRLPDGTDIGPRRFPPASTVATLKETIIAQWPKGEPPHALSLPYGTSAVWCSFLAPELCDRCWRARRFLGSDSTPGTPTI